MREIVLTENIKITIHAAQRFLERIMNKAAYEDNDIEVAIEIIRNILHRRVLKYQQQLNESNIRIKHLNAVFIYDVDEKMVITVYQNAQASEKIEWEYKFPTPLKFKGQIAPKKKVILITYGFMPIRKKGRRIIGQAGDNLYEYDPKHNVVSLFAKD